MAFDLGSLIGGVDDFLRRHFKPKPVQEAEKRRSRRRVREAGRRLSRGALVAGSSGAGIAGYAIAVAPLGTAAMLTAGAAALVATGTALLWPSQRPRTVSRAELDTLVHEAEAWLLERRAVIPRQALAGYDRLFGRLGDLHPRIADMEPNGAIAWDLRRLLTGHIPRLIHAFTELPPTVRDVEPALVTQLVEGLGTLDTELVRICREANRDHLVTFQASERFLDIRYKDDRGLRGE